MKASTERKIIRWLHLIAGIPILGYIYGPVAGIPEAALMVKAVIMPLVILSGLWLWKGQWVRKFFVKAGSNAQGSHRRPLKLKV
ncbi:hypothetical protein [Larkinella soli]|uniref:hypothetical protein n=1 Tax=Larkinella soli TaxID=1770527 RepID=UPI000FFBC441|nr:hypothetical protein [Larkinella soli]